MGLKETILGAADRRTMEVEIPEWKSKVTIREISAFERGQLEAMAIAAGKQGTVVENYRAKVAVRIIIDEDGKPLFTDDDVPALGQKSAKALDRIFDAYLTLNKFTQEEADEFRKNS